LLIIPGVTPLEAEHFGPGDVRRNLALTDFAGRSRSRSIAPVPRAAALVRDCEHDDHIVRDEVGDEVGELGHWHPSGLEIVRNVIDQGADARPTLDRLDSAIDCREKGEPEALSPFLVPPRGVVKFGDRFVDEADLDGHSPSVSARRCRTTFQS